jgi:beta-phosphoglucomutase-like phosphatase (HAD superfamily)
MTAVATSSYQAEAERVLSALGILGELDLVIGRDHISKPKPHPEIYTVTMSKLGVQPHQALIVEDSPVGVAAAAASGAAWVCVANDFTRSALKARRDIDRRWVVYGPARVRQVVATRIKSAESGT